MRYQAISYLAECEAASVFRLVPDVKVFRKGRKNQSAKERSWVEPGLKRVLGRSDLAFTPTILVYTPSAVRESIVSSTCLRVWGRLFFKSVNGE